MTLCIGGPLHGRQAPLSCEDMPSFRAPDSRPMEAFLSNAHGWRSSEHRDAPDIPVVTYRLDELVMHVREGGASLRIYVAENLSGREIAARIAAVLANAVWLA